MARTRLRQHLAAAACALAVAGPLLLAGTTGADAPPASAQTPGEKAAVLKRELRKLDHASADLRRQANAARSALVVGEARWRTSKKQLLAARKDATAKAADLAEAKRHVESERLTVARYAVDAYQNPVGSGSAVADGLGGTDPVAQSRAAADLDQVSAQQVAGLSRYSAAQIAAKVFADRAKRAAAAAARLEASLQRQTVALRASAKKSTRALSRAVAKVNAVQDRVDELEDAEQARLAKLARERAARAARNAGGGSSTGAVGTMPCRKSSSLNYPNGLIPASALCPLPQAGWYLRADAARSFYRLNAAYAARFGGGMCVNSAYRPLQRQYELFRTSRPGYAAVPGTSNHGEGVAVDLGCGINVYRSTQFNWLKANAGRYGWVHPYWAEHSPFEPWHWEYTG